MTHERNDTQWKLIVAIEQSRQSFFNSMNAFDTMLNKPISEMDTRRGFSNNKDQI